MIVSLFACNNGHCPCMYSLIRYRYSLTRYRLVQPISLVTQCKFSCKRQCQYRIRKIYSHCIEKLCNIPILHHLHCTKSNKQVTTFTVLAGKRSHLITCLSMQLSLRVKAESKCIFCVPLSFVKECYEMGAGVRHWHEQILQHNGSLDVIKLSATKHLSTCIFDNRFSLHISHWFHSKHWMSRSKCQFHVDDSQTKQKENRNKEIGLEY